MKESNPKRLDLVLNALSEAREDLQKWQDSKTKALIEIDSFAFDVRLIFEEKNQVLEEYKKAREIIAEQEKDFNQKLTELNEELQEAKLVNENLKRDLETSRAETAAAKNEVLTAKAEAQNALIAIRTEAKGESDRMLAVQNQIEEKGRQEIAKIKADLAAEHAAERKKDLETISQLTEEVKGMSEARSRQETRARVAEHELQVLKTQMHKALGQIVNLSEGPEMTFADLPPLTKSNIGATLGAGATAAAPVANQAAATTPATKTSGREHMQDYLKRLGY